MRGGAPRGGVREQRGGAVAPSGVVVAALLRKSDAVAAVGVLEDHPELGFKVRPGLQMPDLDLIRFSDQFPYLARGVPVLMFNSGFHPDLHTADDEVERADTDKLARASRLMFFLTYVVANNPVDPSTSTVT